MVALSRNAAVLLLSALAAGCWSTRQMPPPVDYVPRQVVEIERFEVRHGADVLGTLVHLEIEDPSGPLRFWRVENRNGSWVGHATEQWRFTQRQPFVDDEVDLGIWPRDRGVARLFRVDGSVELRRLPAPASARRTP